jgi:hypothetical protein
MGPIAASSVSRQAIGHLCQNAKKRPVGRWSKVSVLSCPGGLSGRSARRCVGPGDRNCDLGGAMDGQRVLPRPPSAFRHRFRFSSRMEI